MSLTEYSRKGYDPEWLALEDAMGYRYRFDSNFESKVPEFNNNFAAIAKMWPDPEEPLQIYDEDITETQYQQRARIYQPESLEALPVMVFFHGGRLVAGNLNTDEPQCKFYAAKVPCVVVSIEYPLAPTYKFEAIKEACVEAVRWVKNNASGWDARPDRILLCGGSAGALFASTLGYHFNRVLKEDTIYGCVLMYAILGGWDYDGEFSEHYHSWKDMADGDQPFLNRKLFQEVAEYWELDFTSPKSLPMLDPDLSRFPRSYIVVGGKDILKDDGKVFDMRLKKAGVKSKYKMYEGLPHWFHAFPQLKCAHQMLADTVEGIKWLLDADAS